MESLSNSSGKSKVRKNENVLCNFSLWHTKNLVLYSGRKPFNDVGVGTKEIRIRDATGIYRVMYVAKFEQAIYVLHCFQKKSEATTKQDKAIAETRYRAVVNEIKEGKK